MERGNEEVSVHVRLTSCQFHGGHLNSHTLEQVTSVIIITVYTQGVSIPLLLPERLVKCSLSRLVPT